MTNPFRKTSKHVNLNVPPLTILLLCLSTFVSSQNITDLVIANLNQTILKVDLSSSNFSDLQNRLNENLTHLERCAFEDCISLLDDTVFDLTKAISSLQSSSIGSHDVKMLLSDAMTNQDTCLEGFATSDDDDSVDSIGRTYLLSDSLKKKVLDIYNSLSKSLDLLQTVPGNNHSSEVSEVDVEFPSWISENDQRLIKAPVETTDFNLTVAQDGTGDFTTINDAVSAAPNASETRFVIYIKEGEYLENIEIPKKKTMIMFVGDGKNRTIISSNRSKNDEWSTFQTATVGVRGDGFIAKNITFVNTAGPSKNQAVAFRSGSANSAFYQCAFKGYQDTLYVHSAKQFYRECAVYGTVDFIFGNAAVVFQNCSLYARKPDPQQSITFTAQSRTKADQPTGISIVNCSILAAKDLIPLQADFKAYLGRPWRKYSRTVIIKSFIDDLIDPAGWSEWKKSFALKTLYYGEYMNVGPGANLTNRVTWSGYRSIEDETEASQFTVGPFIDGDTWINSTNIPFDLGL